MRVVLTLCVALLGACAGITAYEQNVDSTPEEAAPEAAAEATVDSDAFWDTAVEEIEDAGLDVCGDGVVVGIEACDGANLDGFGCGDLGFVSGSLSCDDDCLGFDTSACDYGTSTPSGSGSTGGATGSGTATCDDTCTYANDGTCDDGGVGSSYSLCDEGTDCGDCGSRVGSTSGGSTSGSTGAGSGTAGASGSAASGGAVCDDTCTYANDGTCDDGGAGAAYSLCDLGSDCGDCGSRTGGSSTSGSSAGTSSGSAATSGGAVCDDTCSYANDGTCDDGGTGSAYSLCDLGSDCGDCGSRTGSSSSSSSSNSSSASSSASQGSATCEDSCQWANDGVCDDGGTGSTYGVCDGGTDCGDCGPR